MSEYLAVRDAIPSWSTFREHCDTLDYSGEVNPEDGVLYPGISTSIPAVVRQEVLDLATVLAGTAVVPGLMFLRLSTTDMAAPHQAHTDKIMGDFALMLYMNREQDCEGGTALVVHKTTGLSTHPINTKQVATWAQDTNVPDAWSIMDICPMAPNKAMVFNTEYMHRAEPVGGFGSTAQDGRLVLTFFFSKE